MSPSTGPASRPADVKKIAGVTTERSNRPAKAAKPSRMNAIAATSQVSTLGFLAYCRAIATRSRSSGVIRWSASSASSPRSICTQLTVPVKTLLFAFVVVADRGRGVAPDVGRLVRREDQRHGCLDAAFTHLRSVQVERDGAALGEAAAVVRELHPHLVRSRRDRGVALDLEALQAEQVVAVGRAPGFRVQAPAGEGAALGDDHALGARLRHDDFRRDRMGLVLDVDEAVLAEAPHAAEEQLRVALHELRPADELGVEALDAPVVEREHVVLPRLLEPQLLQLGQLLRHLAGEVVRLAPVGARVVELPDVVVERRELGTITHGVEWRVTAVQPWW